MDYLTFSSNVIASLATLGWPLCAFALAVLFRQQIAALLARMRKGRVPGGEFEFSEEAKKEIAVAESAQKVEAATPPQLLETAYNLLDIEPRAAIAEAWRQVEKVATEKLDAIGSSSSSGSSAPATMIGLQLRNSGVLTDSDFSVFQELRRTRNEAIHSDDFAISDANAIGYLVLSSWLMDKIANSQA